MELVRVFLIFMVEFYFNMINANEWLQFSRVRVLNGNMCPEAYVIKEIKDVVKTECLYLCSEYFNCTGAFFHSVNKKCVLCSAKYLSPDTANNAAGYEFYTSNGNKMGYGSIRNIFWLEKVPSTWTNSQEICENYGGYLASIKTSDDNNFILQTVITGSSSSIWTSGTGNGGMASTFVWIDGSSVEDGFTNWNYDQPSHPQHGASTCLALAYSYTFKWDDADCTRKLYTLCAFK